MFSLFQTQFISILLLSVYLVTQSHFKKITWKYPDSFPLKTHRKLFRSMFFLLYMWNVCKCTYALKTNKSNLPHIIIYIYSKTRTRLGKCILWLWWSRWGDGKRTTQPIRCLHSITTTGERNATQRNVH